MKAAIRAFDNKFTKVIVSIFGVRSRPFFSVATYLGDPVTISLIAITLIVIGMTNDKLWLAAAGAAIPITVIAGALLKLAFERARPTTDYARNMWLQTFSFPSGHSNGAVIAYGLLAYIAVDVLVQPWGVIVAIICGALAVAIGISRVYLGAHFPSDVIAGWLFGSVALVVTISILSSMLYEI